MRGEAKRLIEKGFPNRQMSELPGRQRVLRLPWLLFSPLLDVLADVPIPRRAEGKLYKLPHVLLFSPRRRNSTASSPPTGARPTASPTGSSTTSPKASPSSPCRSRTGGACVPPTPSSGPAGDQTSHQQGPRLPQLRCPAPPRHRRPRRNRRRLGNLRPHLHQLAQPGCLTVPIPKVQTSGCSITHLGSYDFQ